MLRAKLTPDYTIGCKRILLSNTYYPALAQPNAEVVTSALTEVRGSTIVTADGTEREVDAIIFGTGFHVTDMPIGDRVRGADGRTLAEHWKDGMAALRGCAVDGFPNLLLIIGPNTGLGNSSMVLMIESAAQLRGRLPAHPGVHRRRRAGRPPRGGARLERRDCSSGWAARCGDRRLHAAGTWTPGPQHHAVAGHHRRVPARHPADRPGGVRRRARRGPGLAGR